MTGIKFPYKTIVLAAIRDNKTGKLFTGYRHCSIIPNIIKETGVKCVGPSRFEQGFIDNDGHFVNREEAGKIAIASGQIKKLKYSKRDLFSEELWDVNGHFHKR